MQVIKNAFANDIVSLTDEDLKKLSRGEKLSMYGIVVEKSIPDTVVAHNDDEATTLYKKGYHPLCPDCGKRAYATNFKPEHVGGKKGDESIVWFCSDMGHCAFGMSKDIKWTKK